MGVPSEKFERMVRAALNATQDAVEYARESRNTEWAVATYAEQIALSEAARALESILSLRELFYGEHEDA